MDKKIILLIILSFSLFGCATFTQKESFKNQIPLSKKDISKLNGTFTMNSYKSISRFSVLETNAMKKDSLGMFPLFYTIKTNSEDRNTQKINYEDFSVEITVIDTKKLSFKLLKGNQAIENITLNYKLKKNGYLYLKNNNFKTELIPGLCGNFEVNRIRIGLNDEKNLILNHSFFIYGAVLFIIGDTKSSNFAAEYRRKT